VLSVILKKLPKGKSKVDAVRLWCGQARQAWKMTKEQWSHLPSDERAEMIVTVKLSDWLQMIESHEQLEEMKRKKR
jgi:hypothetical protein